MNDSLIKETINTNRDDILEISNLDFNVKVNDVIIPNSNLFRNKYRDYIFSLCIDVELTDEAFNIYRYQPKKLSLKLYNNINLWHILLWINNIISISDFSKKKIKILDPNKIDQLYKIIGREEKNLKENYYNPPIIKIEE